MCCFSRPVEHVSGTSIFARALDGVQTLAYSMRVGVPEDLAMILPLPVPPGVADDAVEFIDLQGYPGLFDDLSKAFPALFQPASRGTNVFSAPLAEPLKVHRVGAFDASFVPTVDDFDRLDPRFSLPTDLWRSLSQYRDAGFAVFKLHAERKGLFRKTVTQDIHPMAFRFPMREPDALYFPTFHIHDGTPPQLANFDHTLYCQPAGVMRRLLGWDRSKEPLGEVLDSAKPQSVVDPDLRGFRTATLGKHFNEDLWLRPSPGITEESLTPEGPHHRAELQAKFAYSHRRPTGLETERISRWRHTGRHELRHVAAALSEGVRELAATHREAWHLTAYHEDLPVYFINGRELWCGTSYVDGTRLFADATGPGRVRFTAFTDSVESQIIELAFERLPAPVTIERVQSELNGLLEAAIP
jgi:hypothetical protein